MKEAFKPVYKVKGKVPIFKWDISEQRMCGLELMKKEEPVIFKNFPLQSALKWNFEYLGKHLPQNENSKFSVYTSDQAQFLLVQKTLSTHFFFGEETNSPFSLLVTKK